jgi:DNA-directed RNA polymerase subunit RPC12/RpoP
MGGTVIDRVCLVRGSPAAGTYDTAMPVYICPNCKNRSVDIDGFEGFSGSDALQCRRCGFGFIFQLLEDYYPAPSTGFIVCDRDARVLAAGRGVFELTGYPERVLMGRDLREALGMSGFPEGKDPIALVLEWGVRQLDVPLTIRHSAGHHKPVRCDLFPAYDEDGGLLCSLAPRLVAETPVSASV